MPVSSERYSVAAPADLDWPLSGDVEASQSRFENILNLLITPAGARECKYNINESITKKEVRRHRSLRQLCRRTNTYSDEWGQMWNSMRKMEITATPSCQRAS